MIKIGVMFGGTSVEHEVSIISAVQAMHNLDSEKYDVVPIYMGKDGVWYTGKQLMDIELYKDMDLLKRYTNKVVLYKKGNEYVLQSIRGLKRIVSDTTWRPYAKIKSDDSYEEVVLDADTVSNNKVYQLIKKDKND